MPRSFRLDRELDARLTVKAEREGRSKSAVVSDAIERYLFGEDHKEHDGTGEVVVRDETGVSRVTPEVALARVRELQGK